MTVLYLLASLFKTPLECLFLFAHAGLKLFDPGVRGLEALSQLSAFLLHARDHVARSVMLVEGVGQLLPRRDESFLHLELFQLKLVKARGRLLQDVGNCR